MDTRSIQEGHRVSKRILPVSGLIHETLKTPPSGTRLSSISNGFPPPASDLPCVKLDPDLCQSRHKHCVNRYTAREYCVRSDTSTVSTWILTCVSPDTLLVHLVYTVYTSCTRSRLPTPATHLWVMLVRYPGTRVGSPTHVYYSMRTSKSVKTTICR
jgi:hypothetical protein